MVRWDDECAVARYYGAGTVILSGMLAHRLEIAATHYADITVNVQEQNLADVVHEVSQGYGADAVFVAVPGPAVVKLSLELVRPGGTFNIFAGQPAGSGLDLDLGIVHYKEISIKGTFGATPNQIYEALLLMASKRVDFSPIITKTYRLSQFMEAMEYSLECKGCARSSFRTDTAHPDIVRHNCAARSDRADTKTDRSTKR